MLLLNLQGVQGTQTQVPKTQVPKAQKSPNMLKIDQKSPK